jgi:hypothetical protein
LTRRRDFIQASPDESGGLHALVSTAGVGGFGLAFSAVDFFAFAGADRAFADLVFDFDLSDLGFAFWAFAFVFRSLAHRAFAAALIFSLASTESLRLFCGGAASTAWPADGRSIIAESCVRIRRNSAICSSSPVMARRSNSVGSSLLVLSID